MVAEDTKENAIDLKLKQIDFGKITHLCVAFALIKEEDGKFIPYITKEVESGIIKIKEEIKRQNADTKILLSVGGAGADGFCPASRTDESRGLFTDTIMGIIDRLGLDGIDIDWEFPGESTMGIKYCQHCKKDFILLLKELRNQLGTRLLTVAVGSNRYFGINVKLLGNIADYVFVMTYDLGVMHSNIYLSKAFVTMWGLLGIPKSKLCIGVPFYGKNVKNLEDTLAFKDISKGVTSHCLGQSFVNIYSKKWCFDTEQDIHKKALWAYKKHLGGVFCWEIACDSENRLLNAMNDGINGI